MYEQKINILIKLKSPIVAVAEEVHVFQVATGGLFIAEDIRVKVVDCVRCDEGEDEGNGSHNQNNHIVGVIIRVV